MMRGKSRRIPVRVFGTSSTRRRIEKKTKKIDAPPRTEFGAGRLITRRPHYPRRRRTRSAAANVVTLIKKIIIENENREKNDAAQPANSSSSSLITRARARRTRTERIASSSRHPSVARFRDPRTRNPPVLRVFRRFSCELHASIRSVLDVERNR